MMKPNQRAAIIRSATANISALQAAVAVLQAHKQAGNDGTINRLTEQITTICDTEIEHQLRRIKVQTHFLAQPNPTAL